MSGSPNKFSLTQRNILTVVLVPVFMTLLAVSSINVVLPSVGQSLDITTSQLQWVLSGYTLAFGMVLVAGGRAGDVYGRGKLFIAGLALFAIGSLASGLAPNGMFLDIARVITGFGSGLLNPQTVGFIQQYFSGQRRAKAFASFGSVVGVSVAIGPILGGFLVQLAGTEWGWRWTFLINVPIAVIAIIFGIKLFPPSAWHRPPAETTTTTGQINMARASKTGPDLDPVGMVIFTVGILAIMFSFMEIDVSWWLALLIPVGIGLLWGWVSWERRYQRRGGEPMVNMNLFKIRSFANGTLLIGIYFTGSTTIWITLALYLQQGHGFSALQAAMIGLPSAFLTSLASPIAGRHVLRMGRKLVVYGQVLALTAILGAISVAYAQLTWAISPWWFMVPASLIGIAQGMVVSPNQTLSMMSVPSRLSGAAGGVMQTGQRVGTSLGLTAVTTILFSVSALINWNVAIMVAFGLIAVMMSIALVVAIVDTRGESAPATGN